MKPARFWIVESGLVHRLERRFGLGARILAFIALTWLPILILDGLAGNAVLISKLWVNIPLLLIGPIFIAAEAPIAKNVQLALDQLSTREMVREPRRLEMILDRGRRTLQGRIGIIVEIAILAYVAIVGFEGLDLRGGAAEIGITGGPSRVAALWFGWISLPLLLFLRLRWVWRGVVWVQLLWRVSRLPMNIYPTHSDQRGGLAIFSRTQESFGVFWLATSALASMNIFYHVSLGEKTLQGYYAVVAVVVVLEVLLTLLPLAFFIPALKAAKIRGVANYESLSSTYSRDFDPRWLENPQASNESVLGTPDIQTLADLGSEYDRVRGMGTFPGTLESAKKIALLGALPFIPLVLLVLPLNELIKAAIQLIF